MKHEPTPGPWTAIDRIIYGPTPEDGQVGGAHDPVDADLMAAAPDLLEACKAIVSIPAGYDIARSATVLARAIESAKTAIAKAEGRS